MVCYVRTARAAPPATRDARRLAVAHAHPRDDLVVFDDAEHAYYVVHSKSRTFLRAPVSVSGIYKKFFGA